MKYIGLFLLLLPITLFAQKNEALTNIFLIEDSEIIILGTSNVIDYTCKLHDLSNNANIRISSKVYGHTIKLNNAVVKLKSSGFDCDHKKMTNDFFKAIKGDEFPEVLVEFHQFTLIHDVSISPRQYKIPSKISIQLAGVTNYYSPRLSSLSVKENELTFTGSVKLLMTDFEIDPPTALMGAIKTANEIQIKFRITFKIK